MLIFVTFEFVGSFNSIFWLKKERKKKKKLRENVVVFVFGIRLKNVLLIWLNWPNLANLESSKFSLRDVCFVRTYILGAYFKPINSIS